MKYFNLKVTPGHMPHIKFRSPAGRRTCARSFVADAAQILGRLDQMVGTVDLTIREAGRDERQHQLLVDEIRSAGSRIRSLEWAVGVVEGMVLLLVSCC